MTVSYLVILKSFAHIAAHILYLQTSMKNIEKVIIVLLTSFFQSMIKRNNISITPEYPSLDIISPIASLEQFGHWLAGTLRKNTSSWLHYNLAALFWRIKGNAPKALECCRRAVHYAPRYLLHLIKPLSCEGKDIIFRIRLVAPDYTKVILLANSTA